MLSRSASVINYLLNRKLLAILFVVGIEIRLSLWFSGFGEPISLTGVKGVTQTDYYGFLFLITMIGISILTLLIFILTDLFRITETTAGLMWALLFAGFFAPMLFGGGNLASNDLEKYSQKVVALRNEIPKYKNEIANFTASEKPEGFVMLKKQQEKLAKYQKIVIQDLIPDKHSYHDLPPVWDYTIQMAVYGKAIGEKAKLWEENYPTYHKTQNEKTEHNLNVFSLWWYGILLLAMLLSFIANVPQFDISKIKMGKH